MTDVSNELGSELQSAKSKAALDKFSPNVVSMACKSYFQMLEKLYFGVDIEEFERKRKE